ncbi:MAG: glycoside hydrolase family 16 protein [Fibrobacterales bacterium]
MKKKLIGTLGILVAVLLIGACDTTLATVESPDHEPLHYQRPLAKVSATASSVVTEVSNSSIELTYQSVGTPYAYVYMDGQMVQQGWMEASNGQYAIVFDGFTAGDELDLFIYYNNFEANTGFFHYSFSGDAGGLGVLEEVGRHDLRFSIQSSGNAYLYVFKNDQVFHQSWMDNSSSNQYSKTVGGLNYGDDIKYWIYYDNNGNNTGYVDYTFDGSSFPDGPTAYPGYTGIYSGYTLVIDERFDGNDINNALWAKGDGGVGGETMCRFQPQGVEVNNGTMKMTVRNEYVAESWSYDHGKMRRAENYSCGELRTKNEYRYGRIEARYKLPTTPATGCIQSLFTYDTDYDEWVELDVELECGRPGTMQSNYIYGEGASTWNWEWQATRTWGAWERVHTTPKSQKEWITYAMEWTPSYVKWFMDGVEVRHMDAGMIDCYPNCIAPAIRSAQLPNHFTKIMMNFWIPNYGVGPNFGGDPSGNQYPMVTEYDWFRYYSLNGY